MSEKADVIVVGAGAAGLFAALSLAPRRVIVLSEKPLGGLCASAWSQGGIAAAVGSDDAVTSHAADTLKAGAGTADADVVRLLTTEAPAYINILEKYGVRFDRGEGGGFSLSREACHTRRRVLKAAAGDGFGFELMRALADAVKKTPSIVFVEGVSAEQILRARGRDAGEVTGVAARRVSDGAVQVFSSPAVLLATGGIGGLYAGTTNPLSAVGRGLALAARAGAVLSDLEFVQFHPTALDIGLDPAPLATEALRGEGAYLVNGRGERFMTHLHEMAELAPRDVVSRAIFSELQRGQKVYLDCRHIEVGRFPALVQACFTAGINPESDLIPVKPAVHYHMGGVATDVDGRTNIPGLWAAGEVAATGLHGANRLASNSLMEAIVMAGRAAASIKKAPPSKQNFVTGIQDRGPVTILTEERNALRRIMADFAGVIRSAQGLAAALADIGDISARAEGRDVLLSDMLLTARLIVLSALLRTESRGGHARGDYPKPSPAWQRRSFITLKEADTLAAAALKAGQGRAGAA